MGWKREVDKGDDELEEERRRRVKSEDKAEGNFKRER
jgi:hypothetical protein